MQTQSLSLTYTHSLPHDHTFFSRSLKSFSFCQKGWMIPCLRLLDAFLPPFFLLPFLS